MSESTESVELVRRISNKSTALGEMLREHLDDNFGDMLPHVFFGDLVRYVESLYLSPTSDRGDWDTLNEIIRELDVTFARGGVEVRELIAVSFVEDLLDSDLVGLFERNLRREAERMRTARASFLRR